LKIVLFGNPIKNQTFFFFKNNKKRKKEIGLDIHSPDSKRKNVESVFWAHITSHKSTHAGNSQFP